MSIGFTFPFSAASGSVGLFQMTNDQLSAINQNIRSLILTNWGERLGHYYLGCNLVEFLFEPIEVNELRERIADRIMSQIGTWLPFVFVKNLNVFLSSDDPTIQENSVKIVVDFGLSSRPELLSQVDVTVGAGQ